MSQNRHNSIQMSCFLYADGLTELQKIGIGPIANQLTLKPVFDMLLCYFCVCVLIRLSWVCVCSCTWQWERQPLFYDDLPDTFIGWIIWFLNLLCFYVPQFIHLFLRNTTSLHFQYYTNCQYSCLALVLRHFLTLVSSDQMEFEAAQKAEAAQMNGTFDQSPQFISKYSFQPLKQVLIIF